jgi:hypothetical protein
LEKAGAVLCERRRAGSRRRPFTVVFFSDPQLGAGRIHGEHIARELASLMVESKPKAFGE